MKESIDSLQSIPLPESDKQELIEFCQADSDRFSVLTRSLERRRIPYQVIPLEKSRHIVLLTPKAKGADRDYYRVTFTAHYDRAEGSPGANDNSAAVFQLLSYWEEMRRDDVSHYTQVLFTDNEELTEKMTVKDQGSWHLARQMSRLGISNILFFVLDMCGIGDTPVWGQSLRKVNLNPANDAVSRAHRAMENLLIRYSQGINYGVNAEFSDDLGLLFGGYPAMQLSLLPREEANELRRRFSERKGGLKGALPKTWQMKHGPDDNLQSLEPRAFKLIMRFLRAISYCRFPLT